MTPCFGWHRWGRWKAYEWAGTRCPLALLEFPPPQSEWPSVTELRQRRECERCGKTQDERV